MTREIKFRAWDHDNNKFIHPSNFIVIDGKDIYMLNPHLVQNNYYKLKKERFIINQFTHNEDLNGTPIFEGDIIKTKSGHLCKIIFGLVSEKTSDGIYEYTGFCLHNIKQAKNYHLDNDPIEVIGNIYQNPELCAV